MKNDRTPSARDATALVHRHLRWGWVSLAVYLTAGILLEAMHGLKVGWYLDVANETRRLAWTLGHAHGTLIGLVHVAFATTVGRLPSAVGGLQRIASPCLRAASILLPGGFFLGGAFVYEGDPGLGIFLVPPGALLLLIGVAATARAAVAAPGDVRGSEE